jgi:proliferating cell nuclear antigen
MAKKTKEETKESFLLKVENSKILRAIIETLSSIIDETTIVVTPKEFTIKAMDPSRICLLKLVIKKEGFNDFECNKACKIGLNLDDFNKILKRASSNDSITLEYQEDEQKIRIKMKREGSTRTRSFSLTLLDVDIEEVPMDNLLKIEFNAIWDMNIDHFNEALKDAEIYSEILNVKATEGEGLLFSSSGLIGEMRYNFSLEDLFESDISGGESKGAYSLTFLKSILKIAAITENFKISLKTDHPLKIEFGLLEDGELNYFLAPRVEEAEFDDDDEDDMDEF